MLKLFSRPARPRIRRPERRTVDPTMTFTPRDWADLPAYHPTADAGR